MDPGSVQLLVVFDTAIVHEHGPDNLNLLPTNLLKERTPHLRCSSRPQGLLDLLCEIYFLSLMFMETLKC